MLTNVKLLVFLIVLLVIGLIIGASVGSMVFPQTITSTQTLIETKVLTERIIETRTETLPTTLYSTATLTLREEITSTVTKTETRIKTETKLVDRLKYAIEFLKSIYDSTVGLCAESPRVAPNIYWLVSDNLWAYKALEKHAPQISNIIKSKLIELAKAYSLPIDSQGLPISYKHEAVIGDIIPIPFKIPVQYTLYSDSYRLRIEIANGTATMEDWQEYADLLLLAALSKHWEGKDAEALDLFNKAKDMWDKVGVNDKAARANRIYSTYKLALLLYVSKVLGVKLDFEEELIAKIWRLQDPETGGIITDYYPTGEQVEGADANTETTSITIIALTTTP
jgi:hypothetical protein